jgi:16S rRNA C967 or C1407 C5-methylase (RsmB/RsmF family)
MSRNSSPRRHRDNDTAEADDAALRRYASIVDDVDAFVAACDRPLPRVVWINPLRGDPKETEAALLARCPAATPVTWYPGAWRLPSDSRPGNWPEYRLGLIHAQEEAALWPAILLDAKPGEQILDLCASPANKTAQIAIATGDRAGIIANERNVPRLASMRFNLDRLGITSVAITAYDGLHMPGHKGRFDRAMVDVPCSCEGTARKAGGGGHGESEAFRRGIVSLQIGLLRRALELVRPGGTLVYATCTFAPEENEGVLNAIWPDVASIEPVSPPPGLRVAPGVTHWDGKDYRPDVANAARFWPHHNDTGGFFVAKLRRL